MTTLYASSARDSARYYTRYLAQDGPEAEGMWLGRQADGLRLAGRVSAYDLESLLSGHDPATGKQLGTALVDRIGPKGKLIRAVAGFDATFSAPKSVSVWWALTKDAGVVEAHDVAVRAALAHLERQGTTTRVRVNGRRQFPDANGLTMAVFQQGTSREDQYQKHPDRGAGAPLSDAGPAVPVAAGERWCRARTGRRRHRARSADAPGRSR